MNVFQRLQPQICLRRVPAWSSVTLTLFLSISGFPASVIPLEQTSTPRRFVDWCLNKAKLTSATRHTVEVLLQQAKTQDCDQADRYLSTHTILVLSNNQITDLKPLSSLTRLTYLYLSDNQITDLKPLSSLTHVAALYLQNNPLTTKTCPFKIKVICNFSPSLYLPIPTPFRSPGFNTNPLPNLTVQIAEAESYFRSRWHPPSKLTQTLEYNLIVDRDGKIQRIEPLSQASRDYIDRTGMPLIEEPIVSPNENGQSITIRLILSPNGKVQIFIQ